MASNAAILAFTSSSSIAIPSAFTCSRSPKSALVSASDARCAPPSMLVNEARSTASFCTSVDKSNALSAVNPNPVNKSPVSDNNVLAS